MKEKFTPGPWLKMQRDDHQAQVTTHGVGIGEFYFDIGFGRSRMFNAHLIAAAPEMYELLKCLAEEFEQPIRQEIEELLAKARGEQVKGD